MVDGTPQFRYRPAMKRMWWLLIPTLALLWLHAETVGVGSSKRTLVRVAGQPDAELTMGDQEVLLFHGVKVVLENGRVVEIPDHFADKVNAGATADAKYEEERKRNLAKATPTPKPKPRTPRKSQPDAAPASATPANLVIREKGAKFDVKYHVGQGHVVIVDFFADWCGPCKRIEPDLKRMAAQYGAQLIQVDIVNWETPVTHQHRIKSIPNMRVYGRTGAPMGPATSSLGKIKQQLDKAAL